MSRSDRNIQTAGQTAHFTGAGTNYIVVTPSDVIYIVHIDGNVDVSFVKSTDGGDTWSAPVTIFTGSATALSIWYDRWSGISAGLIHCAYTESVTDDTLYRSIDTENTDTLGTQTTVFAGASTLAGGCLSICRARGGNLYVATMIDAGTEGDFFKSTDVGANWSNVATPFEAATQDQIILLPGWAADNQDMMAFFWDADADEISRKLYDDSADSWAETSIAATMVDDPASGRFPHFAAAVDTTNSRNLLAAWSAVDAANQDLRCWHITESAITEVTNVVANATDDCGFCAICIDTATEDWYVLYGGSADGSETFPSDLSINYKKSTDDGSTWGSQTQLSNVRVAMRHLMTAPRADVGGAPPIYEYGYQPSGFHINVNFEEAAAGGNAKASGNMTGGLQ